MRPNVHTENHAGYHFNNFHMDIDIYVDNNGFH